MTRSAMLRAAGLALGIFLTSVGLAEDKQAIPDLGDAELGKMADQTSQFILDALKGSPDDKARDKARTAAVVLAAVAHVGPGLAQQRATVHEAAVKIAATIRDNKLDEARKKAAELGKLKADPNAKMAAATLLGDKVTFREAMVLFALEANNGMGGERKLVALARKDAYKRAKALPQKEMTDELLTLAYQAAALGSLSKDHNDDKVKKAPKDWQKHAEETRQSALELADAIRKKKGEAAWTALNRLNSVCYECHSQFGR